MGPKQHSHFVGIPPPQKKSLSKWKSPRVFVVLIVSWEASEKELISSRTLWRAHFDLLSNLDELGTCVTPLRLAEDGERLDRLMWQEKRWRRIWPPPPPCYAPTSIYIYIYIYELYVVRLRKEGARGNDPFAALALWRMVLPVWTLNVRRREHELERQTAAHDLERSRGRLAYLSTLVNDE